MNDVTQILNAIEKGDPHAAERLLPLVYDELRKLAGQKMAQEKPGQTLQATGLVHEARFPADGEAHLGVRASLAGPGIGRLRRWRCVSERLRDKFFLFFGPLFAQIALCITSPPKNGGRQQCLTPSRKRDRFFCEQLKSLLRKSSARS